MLEISDTSPFVVFICERKSPLSLRNPYNLPFLWSTDIWIMPLWSNVKTFVSVPSSKSSTYTLFELNWYAILLTESIAPIPPACHIVFPLAHPLPMVVALPSFVLIDIREFVPPTVRLVINLLLWVSNPITISSPDTPNQRVCPLDFLIASRSDELVLGLVCLE